MSYYVSQEWLDVTDLHDGCH